MVILRQDSNKFVFKSIFKEFWQNFVILLSTQSREVIVGYVHGACYFTNFLFIDLEAIVGTHVFGSFGNE